MDADGGYKSTIGFGTASKQLLNDFSCYLSQYNIQHRFYTQTVFGGATYSLNVAGSSRLQFALLIGTSHPQKEHELQRLLARKVYRFSPRPHTLRNHDYWKGQIIDYNAEKLLDSFFDISLVPNLSVSNLGAYIHSLRKGHRHTQLELAKEINITQTMLSKYELNDTTIPIADLLQIFSFYKISLLSFLSKYSKLHLHSRCSHCLLDTQPNKLLLQLLCGLEFKEQGYILIIGQA